MMAVWVKAGALLLVMLTGVTYSYPATKGFDPSSSYSGGHGAYPAPAGSTSGVPYAPAVSGSGTASEGVAYPASYPPKEPSYPQPSVQRQPAATSYSSNSYAAAAPVASGYASGPSPAQPASSQDVSWVVAPPLPLSGDSASTRPSDGQFFDRGYVSPSRRPSQFFDPGYVSLPPPPQFQGGDLSKYEQNAEYGNSESETEEQGFLPGPPPPPPFLPPGSPQFKGGELSKYEQNAEYGGSESETEEQGFLQGPLRPFAPALPRDLPDFRPPGLGIGFPRPPYPFPYDYRFLTGQYPPGTITHTSSSFEQGGDSYEDAHYIRDYSSASPGIEQVKVCPPGFEVPQNVQQPSQPVKQSSGSTSYAPPGAATGYNWAYAGPNGYTA